MRVHLNEIQGYNTSILYLTVQVWSKSHHTTPHLHTRITRCTVGTIDHFIENVAWLQCFHFCNHTFTNFRLYTQLALKSRIKTSR